MRILAPLLILGACGAAEQQSFELASTPRMITVCRSQAESLHQATQIAEAHCQRHDRHAELLEDTAQPCVGSSAFITVGAPGHVMHFRCQE